MIALVIFVGFLVVFVVEFLTLTGADGGLDDDQVTADAYLTEIEPLLVAADPALGPDLLAMYNCNSCHNNGLAPTYAVTIANAADRRAPMTARAYVYEAIVHPGAYVVEGYMNNMPRTYEQTIPAEDLGHMIAYLSGDGLAPVVEAMPESPPETTTPSEATTPPMPPAEGLPLTDDLIEEYELMVDFLLTDNADPERGAELVEQYTCNSCHAGEAAGVIAPAHYEVAQNAAQRRPPLSAAAYIYEAIIYPNRHIVEGYVPNMPQNYNEQIPAGELADIIAYLLQAEED